MRLVLAILAALLVAPASATVMQSGNVTPGHVVMWTTNGVVQDGGTAAIPFLTSMGVVASGPGICQDSGATTGAYNALCFAPTSTGGGFTWTSYNGATGVPSMTINGVVYPFPFSSSGIIGPSTTVLNDLMCWGNTTGTLASDCGLAIGTPTASELLYFSNTSTISALTKANSSVLISSSLGVPSWATTLPSGLTIPSPTISGTFTAPDSGTWGSGGLNGSTVGGTTPEAGHFTTLSATGQITSTQATGSAPFVVSSTTNVPNLNASSLNGATFSAPGAIGGGTASAGTFSGLTDTGISGSTQCVQSNSSGAFSGSGLPCGTRIYLETLTANNSSTLGDNAVFSTYSGYSSYELVFINLLPATTSTTLELQVYSGASYQSTSYLNATEYFNTSGGAFSAATTFIQLSGPSLVANSGAGVSGNARLYSPSQTTSPKQLTGLTSHPATSSSINTVSFSGWWNGGNGAITGFQLLFSSGNITSGSVEVFGIK